MQKSQIRKLQLAPNEIVDHFPRTRALQKKSFVDPDSSKKPLMSSTPKPSLSSFRPNISEKSDFEKSFSENNSDTFYMKERNGNVPNKDKNLTPKKPSILSRGKNQNIPERNIFTTSSRASIQSFEEREIDTDRIFVQEKNSIFLGGLFFSRENQNCQLCFSAPKLAILFSISLARKEGIFFGKYRENKIEIYSPI